MDPPAPRTRPRVLVTAIVFSGLLGGLVGAAVTTLVADPPPDRPVADAVAALNADGGQADRVTAIAAAVLPAVVRIDVRGLGADAGSGNASGVVIDPDGLIVTNHHVIAGATAMRVTFADRSTADAVLVGSDPGHDLAVIRVDVGDLPVIEVADSGEVQVGQLAVVVGSPFGLDGSVSAGIISAIDRPVDLRGPGGTTVRLPGVLQTDAGISPGNSGGPLVDSRGRLIGISSAILSEDFGAGVGFAVPAAIVQSVVEELVTHGEVANPYLGLAGSSVDAAVAAQLGVRAGAVVDRVDPAGPAAAAGLAPEDVITAVDGVEVRGMDDLISAIRAAGVGATIVLDVVRDGATEPVSVTLGDADEQ